MADVKMSPITRRRFVRQTMFAAAMYGSPFRAVGAPHRLLAADKQNDSPLDGETIRKLASEIAGRVITPSTSEYDTARLVFNQAFDRHPVMIVRCASASDVARALEFAQSKHLPLAVRGGGHSRLGYG